VRRHLENPCNRLGPSGRVDGPRPEPVGVVGARRVLGLAADELGDRGRLLADGAALVVVVVHGGVAHRRGVEEGGGGILGAEEVRRVVRHAVGGRGECEAAVTGVRPLACRRSRGGGPRRVVVAQQLLAGRVKRGSGTSDETAAVVQRSVMSDR
jgi:hypothetical protein